MTSTTLRADDMRRQAENMFTIPSTKDIREVEEREKAFATEKQKTERLRALRLARDAEDGASSSLQPRSKARD